VTPRTSTLLLVLLLAACTGTGASPAPSPPAGSSGDRPEAVDTALPPPDRETPEISSTEVGMADAAPEPEGNHRALKRMSVAQTRTAMEQLSGGIEWADGSAVLWESYAATLGVADHQTRLRDNLDPSIMYQKFLDDAAVQTCTAWVAGEADGTRTPRGFFLATEPDAADATGVRANLVRLRQLVHAEESSDTDPVVDGLQVVFDTVLRRTSDPVAAWTTVCVGLFTHPDFFTY